MAYFVRDPGGTLKSWKNPKFSGIEYAIITDSSLFRERSLLTCGERVEDILIYLMEFSSLLSDLCKYFDPHSRISEETPYSFS